MPTKPRTDHVRRTYEFIKTHREQFPIEVMCCQLGVAPSRYSQSVREVPAVGASDEVRTGNRSWIGPGRGHSYCLLGFLAPRCH